MEELRKFYINSLTKVALVVALGATAVSSLAPELENAMGKEHWSVKAAGILTSRLAIVGILWLSERLVRKVLWKWVHPELDLTGLWVGNNTYTNVHVGQAHVGNDVTSGKHEVKIEQDCLSIRIAPSEGAQFGFWQSKAIELTPPDKLVYAYEVHYAMDVLERPEKAYGYEEITLIRRDGEKRPSIMKGRFYHCAAGQTPVLSGTVTFEREKTSQTAPWRARWGLHDRRKPRV